MKKARGNIRLILQKVGEIQTLVGNVKSDMLNDRNPYAIDRAMEDIQKAFNLCLEITGMYDPVPPEKEKKRRDGRRLAVEVSRLTQRAADGAVLCDDCRERPAMADSLYCAVCAPSPHRSR